MTILLGVDPGSRITGYGVIRVEKQQAVYLTSGSLLVQGDTNSDRLNYIHRALQKVVETYQPQEAAVEQVFMHQNAGAALKLGQARGAAIVAIGSIPVAEYSARQIKLAVVGHGAAKKEQVQYMVRILLNLAGVPAFDASDALAVALCHAHSRQSMVHITDKQRLLLKKFRYGRLR